MTARLAAGVEAQALLRRVAAAGGFGAVLAKGDEERGSLFLLILEKGRYFRGLERRLDANGDYRWTLAGPESEAESAEIRQFADKRRRSDPDLWLIELDVPDGERFVAEMTDSA